MAAATAVAEREVVETAMEAAETEMEAAAMVVASLAAPTEAHAAAPAAAEAMVATVEAGCRQAARLLLTSIRHCPYPREAARLPPPATLPSR